MTIYEKKPANVKLHPSLWFATKEVATGFSIMIDRRLPFYGPSASD